MPTPSGDYLEWIDQQHDRMSGLVEQWSSINTGSFNVNGLDHQTDQILAEFGSLADHCERIDLQPSQTIDDRGQPRRAPLGQALRLTKRPDAGLSVLLGIHIDTVFGANHPFQQPRRLDANTLNGPGVADAKGGLVVMLTALEALERSRHAPALGWEVLINPDEEIGSPGSAPLFAECAKRHQFGLVFEPTLPDGTLIAARKGSGNYTAVIRGRAAHVGREFDQGRNAILAAAQLATDLGSMTATHPGLTVNVGRIEGGGPVNIVPDVAVCHFNVRMQRPDDVPHIVQAIERKIAAINETNGLEAKLYGQLSSPPKPLDEKTRQLLAAIAGCGKQLGLNIGWRDSGGVCDGNKLAAAGLATVDTLGPRGGKIHSDHEYLLLDSLTERAKLAALLLVRFASGKLAWQ